VRDARLNKVGGRSLRRWPARMPAHPRGAIWRISSSMEFCVQAVFADARRKVCLFRFFNVVPGEPDFEYTMLDGTIIRVHQHGMGQKGGLP
jgi:hypothetical protein